jgi:hypothetical protein
MPDEQRRHERSPYDRSQRVSKSRTVRIDPAAEVAVSGSLQVVVSTTFWMVWIEVALQHVEEARTAHAAAVELRKRGEPVSGDELRSALVALSAAAFALDGFYSATLGLAQVPQSVRDAWTRNQTARDARVIESLKHGFDIRSRVGDWTTELEWLFSLRGRAVHHTPEDEPPAYRPELDSGFSAEHVRYTAEAARRATAFAFEVISTCIRNPKPHTQSWAANSQHVAEKYEAALQAL